jgi:hypothetical protein
VNLLEQLGRTTFIHDQHDQIRRRRTDLKAELPSTRTPGADHLAPRTGSLCRISRRCRARGFGRADAMQWALSKPRMSGAATSVPRQTLGVHIRRPQRRESNRRRYCGGKPFRRAVLDQPDTIGARSDTA